MLKSQQTDSIDKLIRARDLAMAVGGPAVLDVFAAIGFLAAALGSAFLFKFAILFFMVGFLGMMLFWAVLGSRLSKAKEGRWCPNDLQGLLKMMSITMPIGFAIGILLVGMMPVNGGYPDPGRILQLIVMIAVGGVMLWLALRVATNLGLKNRGAIERIIQLPFEDALSQTQRILTELDASPPKTKGDPVSGRLFIVTMQTTRGSVTLQRIWPKKTRIRIAEEGDPRSLAALLDSSLSDFRQS